jgi:hypothetical protein
LSNGYRFATTLLAGVTVLRNGRWKAVFSEACDLRYKILFVLAAVVPPIRRKQTLKLTRSLTGLFCAEALLIWTGWFLTSAYHRLVYLRVCELVCSPFLTPGWTDEEILALDWQTPLWMALSPWAFIGVCYALVWLKRAGQGRFSPS